MAREAVFTEQISTKVSSTVKRRLQALDQAYPQVSESDAIRDAMGHGLDAMEAYFAEHYQAYVLERSQRSGVDAQITVYVTPEMRARVNAIDERYPRLAVADAVRVAIDRGIEAAERAYTVRYPERADGWAALLGEDAGYGSQV